MPFFSQWRLSICGNNHIGWCLPLFTSYQLRLRGTILRDLAKICPARHIETQHNRKLIEENWDDVLRIAGSLTLGTVNVTELLRALQGGGRLSTLAKAIAELGRISKTLYLLSYIDDPAYRRRILIQLNKGESRHSLARATYFGHKGEVRQRYREGQEEQLGALGLVVNAMVLWNTLYMNRALEDMRARGMKILPEDVERLSPLGYDHINLLGRYTFSLAEDIRQGAFHPLRELEETEEEQEESVISAEAVREA